MRSGDEFTKWYDRLLASMWQSSQELYLVLLPAWEPTSAKDNKRYVAKRMSELTSMLGIPRSGIEEIVFHWSGRNIVGWQLQCALNDVISYYRQPHKKEPRLYVLSAPPRTPKNQMLYTLKYDGTIFLRGTATELEIFRWWRRKKFMLPELPNAANFCGLTDTVLAQEVGDVLIKIHAGNLLEAAVEAKAKDILCRGWE